MTSGSGVKEMTINKNKRNISFIIKTVDLSANEWINFNTITQTIYLFDGDAKMSVTI